MCWILRATTYLRCPQCSTVDITSGRVCSNLTLCSAEVNRPCPLGVQILLGDWNQTQPSRELCLNCTQSVLAEQQRFISLIQRNQGRHGNAGQTAHCGQARAASSGLYNINTVPDFAGLLGRSTRNAYANAMPAMPENPFLQSVHPQAAPVQESGFPNSTQLPAPNEFDAVIAELTAGTPQPAGYAGDSEFEQPLFVEAESDDDAVLMDVAPQDAPIVPKDAVEEWLDEVDKGRYEAETARTQAL